ncbi:MAG TPA: flavodoxin family protein [bacterium]|nr:flavodoxin family protein [bacterium]
MRIVAIMGSYRKGRCVDRLVDEAIAGVMSTGEHHVDKVTLIDRRIEYCRNCLTCRDSTTDAERAPCAIRDDMDEIAPLLERADAFIFGSPVAIGTVTAVMKTFLDRTVWCFARPGRWPLKGCPKPRTRRARSAIIILASGVVPPIIRFTCDEATKVMRDVCEDALNAKVIGSLYAGAVEKRGLDGYLPKARELGRRLAKR